MQSWRCCMKHVIISMAFDAILISLTVTSVCFMHIPCCSMEFVVTFIPLVFELSIGENCEYELCDWLSLIDSILLVLMLLPVLKRWSGMKNFTSFCCDVNRGWLKSSIMSFISLRSCCWWWWLKSSPSSPNWNWGNFRLDLLVSVPKRSDVCDDCDGSTDDDVDDWPITGTVWTFVLDELDTVRWWGLA